MISLWLLIVFVLELDGVYYTSASDSVVLASISNLSTATETDFDWAPSVLNTDKVYVHRVVAASRDHTFLSAEVRVRFYLMRDSTEPAMLLRWGSLALTPSEATAVVPLSMDEWVGFELYGGLPFYLSAYGGQLINSLFLPENLDVAQWAYELAVVVNECPGTYAGPGCSVPLNALPISWSDEASAPLSVRLAGYAAGYFDIGSLTTAITVTLDASGSSNISCFVGGVYYEALPPNATWLVPSSQLTDPFNGTTSASLATFRVCPGLSGRWSTSLAWPVSGRYYVVVEPFNTTTDNVNTAVEVSINGQRCPVGWVMSSLQGTCAAPLYQITNETLSPYDPERDWGPISFTIGGGGGGVVISPCLSNVVSLTLSEWAYGMYLQITITADSTPELQALTDLGIRVFVNANRLPVDALSNASTCHALDNDTSVFGTFSNSSDIIPPISFNDASVTWQVAHPPGGAVMYIAVTLPGAAANIPQPLNYSLAASLSACSANCAASNPCYMEDDGDVTWGMCSCSQRQLYGGEECNQRTTSYALYQTAVALLVASNGAMIAGIIAAVRMGLYTHAVVFFLQMTASAVYHLCDEGYYCTSAGYSTLQVLDFVGSYYSILLVAMLLAGVPQAVRNPLQLAALGIMFYTMLMPVGDQLATMEAGLPITGFGILFGISWSLYANISTLNAAYGLGGWRTGRHQSTAEGLPTVPSGVEFDLSVGHYPQSLSTSLLQNGATSSDDEEEALKKDEPSDELVLPTPRNHLAVRIASALKGPDRVNTQPFHGYAGRWPVAVGRALMEMLFFSGNYRWPILIGGLVLLAIAFACKQFATNADYYVLHSLWHLFVFSSAGTLLFARPNQLEPVYLAPIRARKRLQRLHILTHAAMFELRAADLLLHSAHERAKS